MKHSKQKITIFAVSVILSLFIIIPPISMLTVGVFYPFTFVSERISQSFSQEEMHQHLKDFVLVEGNIISTSDDPWITIFPSPYLQGHILTINISRLHVCAAVYSIIPGARH